MKILIGARGKPSEKYKLNGIFEWEQATALRKLGHEIIYVIIDLRSFRRKRQLGYRSYLEEGIRVYELSLPLGRLPDGIMKFAYHFFSKYIYKNILREESKIDIVHAHFTNIAYGFAMIKDKYNFNMVTTEHSSQINKNEIDLKVYDKAKLVYSKSDKVIAVSTSLANVINRHFGTNCVTINNIVSPNFFIDKKIEKTQNPTFISVGNLNDNKNMRDVIKAFAVFQRKYENAQLNIFGKGPEEENLKNLIQNLNLEGKIDLKGEVPNHLLNEYFNKADIFILASKSETFGVVLIEAIACGIPVISTKSGGPEDIVSSDNGVLVELNDVNAFANAMKNMYINLKKYNKKMMSENCRRQYSSNTIGKKIENVYIEILDMKLKHRIGDGKYEK